MRTRAQTFRLGVFIAVAAALFVGTLIVLSGSALLERRDRYTIEFNETVSGLEVGAAVKLLGIRVGRIESYSVVTDEKDRVEVVASLAHGTPIRADAEAALSGSGLTGLLFVEITGGTAEAPLIKPGGQIPAGASLLGTLTGKAETIAIKVEELINRLLLVLTTKNIDHFGNVLANLEQASASARDTLDAVGPPITAVSERLEPLVIGLTESAIEMRDAASAVRADGALEAAIVQLEKTLSAAEEILGGDNASRMAADIQAAVRGFADTMNDLSVAIGSSEADVRDVTSSLRDAAEHLEEFARAIRENPSLLIRSTEEE